MKIEIRYCSKTGNTKKLAEAIGEELNIEPKSVTEALDSDTDILFLGCSSYKFGVREEVKKFIEDINVRIGKVVNFSTSFLPPSTYLKVKDLLLDKGIDIEKRHFHTKGSFGPFYKNRPNDTDIENIKKFAKEIVNS